VDRIKRISYEVLDLYKSKFNEDFADNKKTLDQVSIVRSKGLKNEIAGYITKFIKKEVREEKEKQARIASSKSEQRMEESSEVMANESVPTEVSEVVAVDEESSESAVEQTE
jgi:small subunit ribosomal protein S17e